MRKLLLLLLLALGSSSCESNREQALKQREDALTLREVRFAKKEAEYKALVKMRDSILVSSSKARDTVPSIKLLPAAMPLVWNSKMVCTESNCGNYVIGDQRKESWRFKSDSTGVYTHIFNNDKLVRVLTGKYHDDKIVMEFASDSLAKNKLRISVVLDDIKDNVLRGTQTIIGQNNCAAKFSVELTPSPKK